MFELPSAIFSIADGNEFRFARFYIVCEAIRLEALESPLIVCACRTFPRWIVKAWQDTEWNVKCGVFVLYRSRNRSYLVQMSAASAASGISQKMRSSGSVPEKRAMTQPPFLK